MFVLEVLEAAGVGGGGDVEGFVLPDVFDECLSGY